MQRHLLRSRAPPNPRDNFSFVIWFLACFHSTRHPLHPVLLWSRDSHPHNPFSLSGKLLKHPGSHRNFLSFLILEVILHLHHVNLVLAAWLTTDCLALGTLSATKNFSKRFMVCLLQNTFILAHLDQRPIELFHPAMRKALHLMHAPSHLWPFQQSGKVGLALSFPFLVIFLGLWSFAGEPLHHTLRLAIFARHVSLGQQKGSALAA